MSIHEQLLDWFYNVVSVWEIWRHKAINHRAYYEGRQWSADEAAELERLGQPVITVNHLWSKVNSLVGLLLQQEPQIKCLPRGKHDAKVASVATSVIRYVFDINQTTDVLADVFLDMITAGIGWVDVRINPFLTYDPILIEYVPFDEVIFDPVARKPDFSDARFVFRGRWLEARLLTKYYPQAADKIEKLRLEARLTHTDPLNQMHHFGDRLHLWYNLEKDLVFVLEAQYRDVVEKEVVWDGVQAEPYDPELHDELVAQGVLSIRKMSIPEFRRAVFVAGELVSDEPLPWGFQGFSLIPFVAYRDVEGYPISLVQIVKDIQDEINKRRSKVLHYLQAIRVVAEEGAIADPDQFMEELRRPDALVWVRRGMNVQIQRDVELGAQHFQLMQEAINEMSLITGIYPDFVGQPTNARTGAALRVRILQSQNSVRKFFSAVERGVKQIAERVLALAKKFYTAERIMQLVDEAVDFAQPLDQYEDAIQVRNTLSSLRADIIVKVRPSGLTEREEQLIQLVELLKSMPPELVAMSLDILIDAFDVPQKEEIKQRFKQLIAMQMQQRQLEQLLAQAKLQQQQQKLSGNGKGEG